MQSPSQKRRNATAQPPAAQPIPAPVVAPDDLLATLTTAAAVWTRPEKTTAAKGRSGATGASLAISWSADTLSLRERLNPVFALPVDRMNTVPGSRYELVASPVVTARGKKLDLSECLASDIPTEPFRGGDSAFLITDLINGVFRSPVGTISLPDMASGDGLPLSNVLAIFAGQPRLYADTAYFQSLAGLLKGFARCSRRYCWLDVKTEKIYIGTDVF
jgi:hypothetical protein